MSDPREGRQGWGWRVRILGQRLRAGVGHAVKLLVASVQAFGHHRGTQLAASMSYYALFAVFPGAILAAAAAGFFLDDPSARAELIDELLEEIPLSDDQGRDDLDRILTQVTENSGTLGLIGLIGLLISASALMSATRNAVNIIFGGELRRGFLRGKALDIALIISLGTVALLSFLVTVLGQLDVRFEGRIGDAINAVIDTTGAFLPIALAAVVFGVLYTVLPIGRPRLRQIWPGVLFAAVVYELTKRGFSIYLENFADYDAVYGSIGAVIAYMFFVWLASIIFLLGAEMVALWPAVRAGEFDSDGSDERSLWQRVKDVARGLVTTNEADYDHSRVAHDGEGGRPPPDLSGEDPDAGS